MFGKLQWFWEASVKLPVARSLKGLRNGNLKPWTLSDMVLFNALNFSHGREENSL
jgi:hypothetical protein